MPDSLLCPSLLPPSRSSSCLSALLRLCGSGSSQSAHSHCHRMRHSLRISAPNAFIRHESNAAVRSELLALLAVPHIGEHGASLRWLILRVAFRLVISLWIKPRRAKARCHHLAVSERIGVVR